MKKFLYSLPVIFLLFAFAGNKPKPIGDVIDESLAFSVKQYELMSKLLKDKRDSLPRSTEPDGRILLTTSRNWTSGFFPGSLWYLYENTGDNKIKENAQLFTARIEKEKFVKSTHDLGFILYCSFGNGLRLTKQDEYNEILTTGAKSLITRYNPKIGLIRSWDNRKWPYPVIIDNMMNLEFLMWAFRYTNDSTYYKIAISHSDMTMKNHYRPDYSTCHVVSYDTVNYGKVLLKQNHQGLADESAWSRGQSWGLYGYTMMYRETKLERYLQQAKNIAKFLINHPNLPADKIPYWDFDVKAKDEPRDASAAAVMASALIELSQYVDKKTAKKYLKVAEAQIRSLSSPQYRAELGQNNNYILKHSVGSKAHNSEVDVPLIYADYYYIEALLRYKKLLEK
jgi:hypothetical protein